MIILTHVIIALSSIIWSGYTIFAPSKAKLYTSYGLVAATFVSGTYLVVSTHAALVSACLTGLLYLGFTTSLLIVAHRRLAASHLPKEF